MIPAFIPPETRSAGEREVFQRLRDDPGTRAWLVLHSLTLAEHDERVAGEIDFLVIMPGKGVLCLEVKGSGAAHLRRDDRGLWFYGPHDRGDPRGPFRQASDGMYALRRQLLQRRPDLSGVQFSFGVIFPFAPFRERSVEWHDWEVIDSHRFRSAPISRLLLDMMDAARAHLLAAPNHPRLDPGAPTGDQCLNIRDMLRPTFEAPVDHRVRAEHLRRELLRFTSGQFLALDAMETNSRTIFVGPAGVGKTFLAMEAARRAGAAGRHVLFLCFNNRLGTWLEEQMRDLSPGVTTRTLHRHMLRVSGPGQAPEGADSEFWQTTLPNAACDRLLEARSEEEVDLVFDELIVDEAQDLLRESYIDFLDLSVRGGLGAGRWRIFGDFEKQAIYDAATTPLDDFRARWAATVPVYSLRVNCRNTPLVAEWVRLLAGLDPGYSQIRRPDDGVNPRLLFYGDGHEQPERLVEVLEELESLGFRGDDVVVLSPKADRWCASAGVRTAPWRDRLHPLGRAARGQIGYCTVHSYKGLEAAAIVVTDIDSITTPRDQMLLYVAATRPLQRLHIIAHTRVRDEISQVLNS